MIAVGTWLAQTSFLVYGKSTLLTFWIMISYETPLYKQISWM